MRTTAPSRSAAARSALSVALYSWSPASSSSPGSNRREARTVETPIVAFGDEREALGVGAQEPGDLVADLVEARHELAVEEPDGLRLHALAPHLLRLEHGRRARAERAVVEEGDVGVEQPGRAVVGRVRHACDDSRPRPAA